MVGVVVSVRTVFSELAAQISNAIEFQSLSNLRLVFFFSLTKLVRPQS